MTKIASLRAGLFATALLMLAPLTAHAAPVLETGIANGNGGYTAYSGYRILGATFTLTQATHITDIGFGADADGFGNNAFGAIVPVDAITGFPTASPEALAATALGFTTIAQPDSVTDVFGALSLDLGPGTYGVVFGGGQFNSGPDDFADLGSADGIGMPRLFDSFFDGDWETFDQDGLRILVDGNPIPVPEPLTLSLFGVGLAGAAGLRRKRRN